MNPPSGPFVVMGVSGCGKTSIARLLAEKTGGLFLDADDFHSPENKARMSAAIPLTDDDRWPWLDAQNHALKSLADDPRAVFLACSALRQVYRDRLSAGLAQLRFIYLKGSWEFIRQRIEARENHFMPAALLDSQFAILEEPKEAIVAPIDQTPTQIADAVLSQMDGLAPRGH